MRTLREVEYEIDMVKREMTQHVIHQSDLDQRLAILDRRLAFLEKERTLVLAKEAAGLQ